MSRDNAVINNWSFACKGQEVPPTAAVFQVYGDVYRSPAYKDGVDITTSTVQKCYIANDGQLHVLTHHTDYTLGHPDAAYATRYPNYRDAFVPPPNGEASFGHFFIARTDEDEEGSYFLWHVYLWDTNAQMWDFLDTEDSLRLFDGIHVPQPYRVDAATGKCCPPPHMGDIHFVRGKWDLEVVTHECLHAISHYTVSRGLVPLGSLDSDMAKDEEPKCYLMGRLVDQIYRELWVADPATHPSYPNS